jgi:CHASE3 domain sensor protein
MNEDLIKKLEEQEIKINKIYESVEKTRKYFQWTLIITVVTIVLPIVVILFILPTIISTYTSTLSGFGI